LTTYLLADAEAAAGLGSVAGVAGTDAVDAAVSTTGTGVLAGADAAGAETCSEAAPECAPASPCISILSPALKIKNKAIAAKTKKPTSAFHIKTPFAKLKRNKKIQTLKLHCNRDR
jgi:hypothetical protein